MSDQDWRDLDERLDQAIDALNDERAPVLFEDDDAELVSLVDTLRIARQLREPEEPDNDYPDGFVDALSMRLVGAGPADHYRVQNGHAKTHGDVLVIRPRRSRMVFWQAAALLQTLGVAVIAGMIAGLIVGGIGGRIVMRISGMLYERANPGTVAITESSGRAVGSFSVSGTIELLVQGMFFGVAGGLFYMIVRPWLPRSGARHGFVYGLLILAIFGTVVAISGDNEDFRRLGAPLLNIAMFAALFVLFGLLIAPLADRVGRFFPPPGPRPPSAKPRRAAYIASILAGALVLPMLTMIFGFGFMSLVTSVGNGFRFITGNAGVNELIEFMVGLLFLGLGVVVPVVRVLRARATSPVTSPPAGRLGRATAFARSQQADAIVYAVLALATLFGATFLLRAILEILSIAG